MDSDLYQYLQDGKVLMGFPSMSVHLIDHDKMSELATESTFGSDIVNKVGSISKLVTAIAVLILCDKQQLELNAPVTKYLFYLKNTLWAQSQKSPVTVKDLLMHTAGLPRGVFTGSSPSEKEIAATLNNRDLMSPEQCDSNPIKYSNLGFVLLGQIIELVTQTPYALFVKQTIFLPLDMKSTGFGVPDPDLIFARPHQLSCFTKASKSPFTCEPMPLISTPPSSSDMHSNTRDIMQLLQCLITGGRCNGTKLLTETSLNLLFTSHNSIGNGISRGMGLLFASSQLGNLVFEAAEHSGHSCVIYMVPEKGFALVAIVNRASAGDELFHMMNEFARHYLTRNTGVKLSHSPTDKNALVGEYFDHHGTTLKIVREEGELKAAVGTDVLSRVITKGQRGLIIENGRLAKYPWFVQTSGDTTCINAGPHQFCQIAHTAFERHSGKNYDALVGIYRNNQVGRIAIYSRGGQLYIAYSPWKEALLKNVRETLFRQVGGPFPSELVRFSITLQQLTLSDHSFLKTTEVY